MLTFLDVSIRYILWETDKLETFLETLGLRDVAPVVLQIFYSLANVINLGLLGASVAMIFSTPKVGTTLLLLFASIEKSLIASYGMLSIQYPFLFEIDNGPLKYPKQLAEKFVPKTVYNISEYPQ